LSTGEPKVYSLILLFYFYHYSLYIFFFLVFTQLFIIRNHSNKVKGEIARYSWSWFISIINYFHCLWMQLFEVH
jgi:hypothetical protein